jgi:hypothetical protein
MIRRRGQIWTLWAVKLQVGHRELMTIVYARDRLHAKEKARPWIWRHEKRVVDATFEEHPEGYASPVMTFPGHLTYAGED